MSSFKELAYQILKEAGKPLHSKEITKTAIERGWLKTAGKTPEATMNAQLVVDINAKKERSRFKKAGKSIFTLNEKFIPPRPIGKIVQNRGIRCRPTKRHLRKITSMSTNRMSPIMFENMIYNMISYIIVLHGKRYEISTKSEIIFHINSKML